MSALRFSVPDGLGQDWEGTVVLDEHDECEVTIEGPSPFRIKAPLPAALAVAAGIITAHAGARILRPAA